MSESSPNLEHSTGRRLIDLSHPLEQGQLSFPGDTELSVAVHSTVATIGYNGTRISISTHQGTHLDAPYHFFDDGKTVDEIPLDRFYGPATLVDLAPGASLEPNTPSNRRNFSLSSWKTRWSASFRSLRKFRTTTSCFWP